MEWGTVTGASALNMTTFGLAGKTDFAMFVAGAYGPTAAHLDLRIQSGKGTRCNVTFINPQTGMQLLDARGVGPTASVDLPSEVDDVAVKVSCTASQV